MYMPKSLGSEMPHNTVQPASIIGLALRQIYQKQTGVVFSPCVEVRALQKQEFDLK